MWPWHVAHIEMIHLDLFDLIWLIQDHWPHGMTKLKWTARPILVPPCDWSVFVAKNSYLNMLKRKKLLDKAYQTLQRVLCRSTCFAMLPHQHSTRSPQRLFYVAMTRARNRLAWALSSPRWDSLAQPDSIYLQMLQSLHVHAIQIRFCPSLWSEILVRCNPACV